MASFVVWNAELVFVAAPNTNVSLFDHLKKIDSLVRRKDFVLSHLALPRSLAPKFPTNQNQYNKKTFKLLSYASSSASRECKNTKPRRKEIRADTCLIPTVVSSLVKSHQRIFVTKASTRFFKQKLARILIFQKQVQQKLNEINRKLKYSNLGKLMNGQ